MKDFEIEVVKGINMTKIIKNERIEIIMNSNKKIRKSIMKNNKKME